MTFEPKSFNAIFTDMRNRTGLAITDFEVGSVARTMYESFAYEIALLYEKLHQVYLSAYIDTAQGSQLDMVVAILDIKRTQPDFATGVVTFTRDTGTEDIAIPLSTLVATIDSADAPQKTYATIEPATLPKDHTTVDVKVQAINRGEEQATPAESVVVMPRPVTGIKSVVNRDPIRFRGRRRETDEELRERAKNALIASGKATIFSLEHALLSLPGVKDVLVAEPFHFARGAVIVSRAGREGKIEIGQGTGLAAMSRVGNQTAERPFKTVATAILDADEQSVAVSVQAQIEGTAGQVLQTGNQVTWHFIGEDQTFAGLAIRNADPILLGQFGIVDVFVDSVDFRDPSKPAYTQERQRLQNAIDQVRGAGIMARLKSAEIFDIDAVFAIETAPNLKLSAVERAAIEADARAAIVNYISERKMGQPLLFSQIIKLTLSLDGIDNLENFAVTTITQADVARNTYDPADKRIDIEAHGKFNPRYICVASETKPLPIDIQFRAEGLDRDKLARVQEHLTAYFASKAGAIKKSAITGMIQQTLNPVYDLRLEPRPWCPRELIQQEQDDEVILVSFVEQPELGQVFAYDACLQISGALKLTLPSTITGAEKQRVRQEIEAGIRAYFDHLPPEADVVFAESIAIAAAVNPVLNVNLDPTDFWVIRAPDCDAARGVVVNDTRLADDNISVEEFEKVTFAHVCITSDVEEVRVEVLALDLAATITVTVSDPLPADFDEARIVNDTRERVGQAVKQAINNALIKAAPGEDVLYADLENAIQNLVPGISYFVRQMRLRATALADGRVQEVPLVVADQLQARDIHIRSVEKAFMQPIPLQPPLLFRLDARPDEVQTLASSVRTAFADNNFPLAPAATITAISADMWHIQDPGIQRAYVVRQVGDRFDVYPADPVSVQVTVEKITVPRS